MVKTALFDMDETLCDTWGKTLKDLTDYFPQKILKELHPYEDSMPQEIKERIKEIQNRKDWWRTLPVLEKGIQLWQYLRTLGFETALATKGPYLKPQAWGEKFQWQKELLPEADEMIITSKNKERIRGEILVDDWPSYVLGFLEKNKNSIAIIPEREYNLKFKHPRTVHYTGNNFEQLEEFLKKHKLL